VNLDLAHEPPSGVDAGGRLSPGDGHETVIALRSVLEAVAQEREQLGGNVTPRTNSELSAASTPECLERRTLRVKSSARAA